MNVEYICDDNIGSIGPSASQLGGDGATHSDSMSLNEIMGTVGLSSPHGLGASPTLVGTAHIFLSPCRSISGEEALGYTPPPKHTHRYNKVGMSLELTQRLQRCRRRSKCMLIITYLSSKRPVHSTLEARLGLGPRINP